MTQTELFEKLQELNVITKNSGINKKAKHILRKHPSIQILLDNFSPFFNETTTIQEKIYCIEHNILIPPKCVCGKNAAFVRALKKYGKYCSEMCHDARLEALSVHKQTIKTRYNIDNFQSLDFVKIKKKETNNKKYGGNAPMCSPVIQQKSEHVKCSIYGNNYNAVIAQKRMHSHNNIHGVNSPAQKHMKDILSLLNKEWLIEQHITQKRSLTNIANELNISVSTVSKYFQKFNIKVKMYYTSELEQEIINYIRSICDNAIITRYKINSHSRFNEIDIFIPDLKIGFEINGLYWHGEINGEKNKQYHITKHNLAKDNGIRLYQIYENEWRDKQEIVKSRILNILGYNNTNRIYARLCTVVTNLDKSIVKEFMNTNHLQGYINYKFAYGLLYNDKIVSIMTFSLPNYNKKYEYEISRFCTVLNTAITGGASKLFKHFILDHSPRSVISYCDYRWGDGEVYIALGMDKIRITNPNYFYFNVNENKKKLYSRIKFQKHKLRELLPVFSPELTEWENMKNNGYDRIWDCGNLVFEYIKI